jgi:cation diffusion facilitator CzcD-associated flavoprotein CzcO
MSVPHTSIAIVGSGFSGLGTAIRLKQAGIEDFVVLERAHEVGGTWRDNSYPGCQCDVPSHLYSFSFAPNPEWTHTYSPQPEILAYLRRCADEHGLRPHIRLGTEVTALSWEEPEQRWRLDTPGGPLTAQMVVLGLGQLSEPRLPDVPGAETFAGASFHSARWDHEHDLSGERVAVIGTGASAIQFVPKIQPHVGQLHLFQRTPPWILPHSDRPITGLEQRLYRAVPPLQRLTRASVYVSREALVPGLRGSRPVRRLVEAMAKRHLHKQVSDPELRRKLTPRYAVGCKRILISDAYYPALAQPNVEVVTDRIAEIRPHSVVTADGREREVDTIVYGTGFHVTDFPAAQWIRGRGGRLLADEWASSMQAHRGTTIAGFPNLFVLIGPNTGLGHSSMVYMVESQLNYVMDAVARMRREGLAVADVRPEAQEAWNRGVQAQMPGTVWLTGGCASWYLDQHGRNTALWPTYTFRFRELTRTFDAHNYRLEPARAPAKAPAPAGG